MLVNNGEDDTSIVRTLSAKENGSCSKRGDSGELENCSQEWWTT